MKYLAYAALSFALLSQVYADDKNPMPTSQELKIELYKKLYPQQAKNAIEAEKLANKLTKSNDGIDTYTFPNQTIDSVYQAYVEVHAMDNFGDSILHKELPKTSKAFKKDATHNEMGYVLTYIWQNENTLGITDTRFKDEDLCGKEVLDFTQDSKKTTLTASFQQYCF